MLVGLAALFGVHAHSGITRDYRQTEIASSPVVAAVWTSYVLHAVAVGCAAWRSLWPVPVDSLFARSVGTAFAFLGILAFVAGLQACGSLARMNGREPTTLIETGAYRWSRNPQNAGWIIALLGIAMAGRSLLAILLVVIEAVLLHLHFIRIEEPHLERLFGDEYRAYRRRVRRYVGRRRASAQQNVPR